MPEPADVSPRRVPRACRATSRRQFGAVPSSTATAITKRFLGWAPTRPCSPRFGLDFELLDAGCCGIAGAFGFVKKHYNVSIACGERVLLPSVRAAGEPTVDRD